MRSLTVSDLRRYVHERCFTPCSDGRVGIEVEWLTINLEDPGAHVALTSVNETATGEDLPGGSLISFEPGGQLELSSLAHPGVGEACGAIAADAQAVRDALLHSGIGLVGLGLDPIRTEKRLLDTPRYRAMEAYFDAQGPAGRRMMCGSAAVQVNLELGSEDQLWARWRLANTLGPTLAAAFANSPFVRGIPSGWRSSRLATWGAIDTSRTASVDHHEDSADVWARYALNARVMFIRETPDTFVPVLPALTFGRWIEEGHPLGYPTEDDLVYHLTTLFPPVRPRGWLEVRMIDALPDPWWRVATAVAAAVLYDDEAAERSRLASEGAGALWTEAARHGLGHPVLADSARQCFVAALEALPRIGADRSTAAAAADYHDRYVARGRTPADDRLQAWAEKGSLLPFEKGNTMLREAVWT